MKYLLHHTDSAYDATSKKFTFTLDRRLANPVSLRINKCTFTAATATTYPPVVYLRSDALTSLSKVKHTVELKSSDHENNSNVLAVLEETHTRGRYALRQSVTFAVHKHTTSRSIDIYFTDGSTVLSGEVVAAPSGVTDSDIAGIQYLKLWQDMREDTLLDSAYANTPNIGDSARYIYQNSNAMQSMVFSGYNDFTVSVLGAGRGISSTNSWNYLIDGSMPNKWDDGGDITYVFSFKMAHTASSDIKILNHRAFEIEFRAGVVKLKDNAGTWVSTNLVLLPTKDYMLTIRRLDADSNGVFAFETTLENLETNAISTGDSVPGPLIPEGNQTNWWYSTAQQHYFEQSGVFGPLIAFNSVDATDVSNAQSWIRSQYTGDTTSDPDPSSSTTEDASFFVELDIKSRN